ncbi:MAG: RidA family protein [Candidatus Binataceae bacterium]|nr:RidA family protein [Candidatus Binataceae bacterium]
MSDETRSPTHSVTRLNTGQAAESSFGYARAVRAGNWILVSGCTATDESGQLVGLGQMYTQGRVAIGNIRSLLERMGASLADVVRTRIYVTNLRDLAGIAQAHREAFGDHPPASTLVEIVRLVRSDALIEIEADALIATPPEHEAQSRSQARSVAGRRRRASKN